MAGTFYAAVHGDPLTSGKGSYVIARGRVGTVQGYDGRHRQMAYIGDSAFCSACNVIGEIVGGAPLVLTRRMYDMASGKRQAVGGDMVACKCSTPPRIIAQYGCKWVIRDQRQDAHRPSLKAVTRSLAYDEQFTLRGADMQPLANVHYRVRTGAKVIASGVTDSNGRTGRIATEDALRLTLEIAANS